MLSVAMVIWHKYLYMCSALHIVVMVVLLYQDVDALYITSLLFCAVEKVLKDFRKSFNECIDVDVIKYDLEEKDIIAHAEIRRISEIAHPREQRQYLRDHLQRKCTAAALIDVCNIISAVEGNPRMKKLGEDMKRQLMGKVYVHVFLHLPKMRE